MKLDGLTDDELCKWAESRGAQISWSRYPDEFQHTVEVSAEDFRAMLKEVANGIPE
jgi:hypothetical protein